MNTKYEITDIVHPLNPRLHRIRALRDGRYMYPGELGGYVEGPDNLSAYGECWIGGDACVMSKASVQDEALVQDHAIVTGNVMISHEACAGSSASISDNAKILGWSRVFGSASIGGHAVISSAVVTDNATVTGVARVGEDAFVGDKAMVGGTANVYGPAQIRCDAVVMSDSDYIVFKNWWSSGRYFTWTRSNDMWSVGCFHGSAKELLKKAYADTSLSGREYEHIVSYVETIKESIHQ